MIPIRETEVTFQGDGKGGSGDGAKYVMTFRLDVALGADTGMAAFLLEKFGPLADTLQRGAVETGLSVDVGIKAKEISTRRFTLECWAPTARGKGPPTLRFVDCVLSGDVTAKVTGDTAEVIMKISTPVETLVNEAGVEIGVRTLQRLHKTNLWLDFNPQEGDATDAEQKEEAPKRRDRSQLSFDEAVQKTAAEVVALGWGHGEQGDVVVSLVNPVEGAPEIGGEAAEVIPAPPLADGEQDSPNPTGFVWTPPAADGTPTAEPDEDPTGPYEVRITSAAQRPDIMVPVLALKKMFGIDNALAQKAMKRAIDGGEPTIVGRGLSERAASMFVADLLAMNIMATAVIPAATDRDRDFVAATEKEIRAMEFDGRLDDFLSSLSDAEAHAQYLSLTQTATRAKAHVVADKIRHWIKTPRSVTA